MSARQDKPCSSGSSGGGPPSSAAKIQALLDQILALDKSTDEVRTRKIATIKKALAEGTYHVSAAEVARKLIDRMRSH